MSDLNRRQFVIATVSTVCACAMGEICAAAGPTSTATTIDIGTPADYAKDGVTDKWSKTDKFFVVRNEGKLYAPSAICTHKRNTLRVKEGQIYCASHGSKFSLMGVPTKGPAKSPLYRYAITKDSKGHLIVDKTKQFDEKDWDKADAFLKLD